MPEPGHAPNETGSLSQIIAQILAAVKSPMIFNALVVIVVALLLWHSSSVEFKGNPSLLWIYGIGGLFIAVVTFWLNWFAARNPRFLAYGPQEYLRESELEHERRIKGIR